MIPAAPHLLTRPPGPRSRELSARVAAVECPAFEARRDARAAASGADQSGIVYDTGDGHVLTDVDGNRYVDLTAGFGALVLGHRPAAVAAALARQAERLWLALGDVYASDVKVALCERLVALMPEPGARVMLGSSGADAVTAALKSAVLHTGRARVVAFEGAYHGLSYAPLAACGLQPGFRAPFAQQLGDHVDFVPYPVDAASADRCRAALDHLLPHAGAILFEPVLGRGGCFEPVPGFAAELRHRCDASGAALIADEVWTGMGRSGSLVATLDLGVVADLVCLGKGLGGGLPVSACIGRAEIMAAWGQHGGTAIHTATHAGAPLGCAAALAVLDELERRALPARARVVGARFQEELRRTLAGLEGIRVHGAGLMIGVSLGAGQGPRALAVARELLERGYLVLTGGSAGNVLTLTPPLDVPEEALQSFAAALAEVLRGHAT